MKIKLYDLAARDTRLRFSPYCWRTKMALKHKGLPFETIPWRFTDKEAIAVTGQGRVPVLVDRARWVHESWDIAIFLDATYPDRPPLMGTPAERAAARFVNSWCDLTLHPALRPLLLLEVYKLAAEKDQGYFRETREKLVGVPLEELCADQVPALQAVAKIIAPVESTLSACRFLGGEQANYADYVLFGSLQWARTVSDAVLYPPRSATAQWMARLLDQFDGYAQAAPTARDLVTA
jgi:glutathione S-transferase